MGLYTEDSREKIDETVERWKRESLLAEGSLIFVDRSGVWSEAAVRDLYARFNENQLEGSAAGGTFSSKWRRQLDGALADVRLLAAEILLVHFLFAASVGGARKRKLLVETLGENGPDLPKDSVAVQAMDECIGGPGVGFNSRRDLQVGYLIDFVKRLKERKLDERQRLLEDAWAMRDFADESSLPLREMRHIVLHLLFPEQFERIASGTHKREIAAAFEDVLDEVPPEDLDERLLAIRHALTDLLPQGNVDGGQLDFYYEPLKGVWNPTSGGQGDEAGDVESLEWKKQLILYGPPGTSKTWEAKELAETVIRRAALKRWGAGAFFSNAAAVDSLVKSNITWLQLHPGFGYDDFIRGLRLEGDRTRYQPGALPEMVARLGKQEVPDGLSRLPGVLVLDEINRTDLSAMFGEAFSLLERDQRGNPRQLPGFDKDEEPINLVIPEDLYVIGTMNEIDQSVETLDFALRRRFLWRSCPFSRDAVLDIIWVRWERDVGRFSYEDAETQLNQFADRAQRLNDEIEQSPELGRKYQIGHTYFADLAFFLGVWARSLKRKPNNDSFLWKSGDTAQPPLLSLWDRSLGPLLEQYLSGSDVADDELRRLRAIMFTR